MPKRFTIFLLVLFLAGCQKAVQRDVEVSPKSAELKTPERPDYSTSSRLSAAERRLRTNQFLKTIQVPTLDSLPVVEDHNNARLQNAKDVARRCVIMYVTIFVVHGEMSNDEATSYLRGSGLWSYVSPRERRFFATQQLPDEIRTEFSWSIEALNVLLWSLGKIQTLDLPRKMCDFATVRDLPDLNTDPNIWIERAAMRNSEDILNELDLTYRVHWAIRDGNLNGYQVGGGFHPGIVYERHRALNWLSRYHDEWDEVTTDT